MVQNTSVRLQRPHLLLRAPLADEGAPVVQEAIVTRFQKAAYSELRRISCFSQGKSVRLEGRVSSYYLRQIAQALAQSIDGVESIDNRLVVMS